MYGGHNNNIKDFDLLSYYLLHGITSLIKGLNYIHVTILETIPVARVPTMARGHNPYWVKTDGTSR